MMEVFCVFETELIPEDLESLLTRCFNSYALSWLVTLPLEIVAASITVGYWPGARSVNPAAWVTIFLVVIISINLFGVRGYGEAEFVFSIIKVAAVLGFM
jgi:yeast amino acid transporter